MDCENDDFDEYKPFHERTPEEWWDRPYGDSYQRQLRDQLVGPCAACYDQDFEPTSKYITRREIDNVFQAINFANYQGAYLNVRLTLAWQRMGYLYAGCIHDAFERYRDTLRRHIRGQGLPFYHYAVFENSNIFGIHSHEALHVPAINLPEFKRWLRRRIMAMNRANYRRALHADYRAKATAESQWRWFRYLMKGLDPRMTEDELLYYADRGFTTAHDIVGIRKRKTGIVSHDRVRISQDMQKKARKTHSYRCETLINDECPNTNRYSDAEFERGRRIREFAACQSRLGRMEII